MSVSVTTIAPTLRLTTRARVQEELGIASDGPLIDALIDRSSAAIVAYCHRPFAREVVTETMPAYGGIYLQLSRTPLVGGVPVITYDGEAVTDAVVHDAERGVLYRQAGWDWSAQRYAGLAGGLRWLDYGSPLPGQEEPLVVVGPYPGGYLLPPENLIASTTISASAADNSFNDTASRFPALLKAGDILTASGFDSPGNNGRFVVSGTPTAAKVVVTATLTNESAGPAGPTVDLVFQTLPYDVEKAAIETAKAFYAQRQSDPNLIEKQVGPMRMRYSDRGSTVFTDYQGLPSTVVGLLKPWVRAA